MDPARRMSVTYLFPYTQPRSAAAIERAVEALERVREPFTLNDVRREAKVSEHIARLVMRELRLRGLIRRVRSRRKGITYRRI